MEFAISNLGIYESSNDTHDVISKISRKYGVIPSFAIITISCTSREGNLIPKCGGEYYAVLNELEEI
jgi:hypothetical protein